jgi:hypothetical protein
LCEPSSIDQTARFLVWPIEPRLCSLCSAAISSDELSDALAQRPEYTPRFTVSVLAPWAWARASSADRRRARRVHWESPGPLDRARRACQMAGCLRQMVFVFCAPFFVLIGGRPLMIRLFTARAYKSRACQQRPPHQPSLPGHHLLASPRPSPCRHPRHALAAIRPRRLPAVFRLLSSPRPPPSRNRASWQSSPSGRQDPSVYLPRCRPQQPPNILAMPSPSSARSIPSTDRSLHPPSSTAAAIGSPSDGPQSSSSTRGLSAVPSR